jgi:aminoglycoside phosphotransferase (APT) family kinase protein
VSWRHSFRSGPTVPAAHAVWDAALATSWQGGPVWIHSDVSSGNLLVRDGRLSAVVDFGMLGVGDNAMDAAEAFRTIREILNDRPS